MALMIPDAAGIYTEAEPPLAYDPVLEAYRDTEGHVYDPAQDAWGKVWPEHPKILNLYNEGDECISASGGWVSQGFKYYSSAFSPYAPEITKNSDHIYIVGIPAGTRAGIVCAASKIDLTAYAKLCCVASGETPYKSSAWAHMGIYSDFDHYYNWEYPHDVIVTSTNTGAGDRVADRKLIEVDISGISGSYYVGIYISSSAYYAVDYVKLHRCWLERQEM